MILKTKIMEMLLDQIVGNQFFLDKIIKFLKFYQKMNVT